MKNITSNQKNISPSTSGSFIMFGLNPGCLTGIPEWDRYKSVRYVSDTGGVLSQGVGENTHVKYGVGKETLFHSCILFMHFCT